MFMIQHGKLQFHQSLDLQSTAFQGVTTTLLTLQNRATLRCRSFMILQFSDLGVPKTNISLRQQYLLFFKCFMTFIDATNKQIMMNLCRYGYLIYATVSDSFYELQIATLNEVAGTDVTGNRHHGRKFMNIIRPRFYQQIRKRMREAFKTRNPATQQFPFFGLSADGMAMSGSILEVTMSKIKLRGVMQMVPLVLNHILWRNGHDTWSGL